MKIISTNEMFVIFCPFCGENEGYVYLGTEDDELYECKKCLNLINYTNPNHT